MLDQDHQVCAEGDVLDSKQTRLLKLFGVETAEFRVRMLGYDSRSYRCCSVRGLYGRCDTDRLQRRYWSSASSKVIEVDAMEE